MKAILEADFQNEFKESMNRTPLTFIRESTPKVRFLPGGRVRKLLGPVDVIATLRGMTIVTDLKSTDNLSRVTFSQERFRHQFDEMYDAALAGLHSGYTVLWCNPRLMEVIDNKDCYPVTFHKLYPDYDRYPYTAERDSHVAYRWKTTPRFFDELYSQL